MVHPQPLVQQELVEAQVHQQLQDLVEQQEQLVHLVIQEAVEQLELMVLVEQTDLQVQALLLE